MYKFLLYFGLSISLLSASVCWIPYIGIYGLFGFVGSLLCANAWYKNIYKKAAMTGIVLGLVALIAGLNWWHGLDNLGGHLF